MEYNRKVKRGICASLCALQMFATQGGYCFAKTESTSVEAMTQERIDQANNAYNNVSTKMNFITMSDTEFMAKPEDPKDSQQVNVEQQSYLYQRIADWANANSFDVEAIMVNGDVVGGNESEYNAHQNGDDTMVEGWYRAVDQVLTESFGEDVKVLLSSGNHDIADLMGDTFDETHKDDGTWFYGDSDTDYVGNFHTTINDFDFITLDYNGKNTFGYTGQKTGYQDFLKQTLQTISSQEDYDETKPIFIQAHSGYAGTSLGGAFHSVYDMMGNDLQTILKEYPQAVVFSAHTHFSVEQETSIYQKDFTFVENGSMNYMYLDTPNSFVEGGYFNSNTGNQDTTERTCNFISILEDGTTVIRRFDVSNQRWIGMPWVVDTTQGKDGFQYTDSNRSTIAPWFDETASIEMKNITEHSAQLNFSQALDDELVTYYEIQLTDAKTNQPVSVKVRQLPDKSNTPTKTFEGTFRAYSKFYYRPNLMSFDLEGLESGTTYQIAIYAVDDFENRSTLALCGEFKTGGVVSLPTVDGPTQLPETIQDEKYFELLFDGNLADSISNTTTAKSNGNVTYVESFHQNGQAVRVGNKNSDYINLGQRDEWKLGTDQDITINFWIKVTSNSGYAAILSNKNWSSFSKKGINIAPQSSDTTKLEFTLGDDKQGVYATGTVDDYKGAWHMMSFTIDREAQRMRTYYDGVMVKESDIKSIGDATSTYAMMIGTDGNKQYGTIGFDMDDLAMWSRPLSSEDIQALYNVSNDYRTQIEKAMEVAEEVQEEITKHQANGQVYEEDLLVELQDAVAMAKKEENKGTLSAYLRLKNAIEALQAQPVYYQVSASATNGSITPQNTKVEQGSEIRFTLTPQTGYHIDQQSIELQGSDTFELVENTVIVKDVTTAIRLHVTYAKDAAKPEDKPENKPDQTPEDSEEEDVIYRVLQSEDERIQIEGMLDKETLFSATSLSKEDIEALLMNVQPTGNALAGYELSLMNQGMEVQPNAELTVRITMDPTWNKEKLAVLHIDEDGTWSWLNTELDAQAIIVQTNRFSKFIVVEKASEPSQPPVDEDQVSPTPNEKPKDNTQMNTDNVTTSDATRMDVLVLVFAISLGGMLLCYQLLKKKETDV